jgi:hypothetical protein
MRREIERMRDELRTLDSTVDLLKNRLSSLKDELHCVEIYEKRKTDLAFETEKSLIGLKDENQGM